MAYHRIVLMRFAEPFSDADVERTRELLDDAGAQVDGMLDARFGRNRADAAYSHGLHARFADRDAHERYLPHPAHKAIGAFLRSRGLTYELLLLDEAG